MEILLHHISRKNSISFLLNLQFLLLIQVRRTLVRYQSQMSGNDRGISFFWSLEHVWNSTFTVRKVASNKLSVYPNESHSHFSDRICPTFISKSREAKRIDSELRFKAA